MSETMMTKHEIEIPDLPEGWEAVAYRYAHGNEYVLSDGDIEQIRQSISETSTKRLIVRKKQPRRVVLEETEVNATVSGLTYEAQWFGSICVVNQPKIWRVVEEE